MMRVYYKIDILLRKYIVIKKDYMEKMKVCLFYRVKYDYE